MAIPKKPAEGENPGGFVSITPNGDARDPTQARKKPDGFGFIGSRPSPYGSRDKFDQLDPGETDETGARHDW